MYFDAKQEHMFNSQNQFGDIFSTFLLAGEDIVDRKGVSWAICYWNWIDFGPKKIVLVNLPATGVQLGKILTQSHAQHMR